MSYYKTSALLSEGIPCDLLAVVLQGEDRCWAITHLMGRRSYEQYNFIDSVLGIAIIPTVPE